MSDAPKIVHDRLRAAAPRAAHPEADVLTAFYEQALSGAEREDVLRHLSRCGECREVMALSIPPPLAGATPIDAEKATGARPRGAARQAWLAWPTVRWAGVAAGVAVVASVLLLRPERQSETTVAVAPAGQNERTAPPSEDKFSGTAAQTPAQLGTMKSDSGNATMRDDARAVTGPGSVHTRAAAGAESFEAKPGGQQRGDQLAKQAPAAPAAVIGGPLRGVFVGGSDAPARPIQKSKDAPTEEMELESRAQKNEIAGKPLPSGGELDSNIARAKKLSAANIVPQWSLAQGRLQRSSDAGTSWQTVLQLQQSLLCVGALGSEVWAGGQGGTLAHSNDGGTAWTMVHPATEAVVLSGDIVVIEVRSATEIALSTSSHEQWTTSDAGHSWTKK